MLITYPTKKSKHNGKITMLQTLYLYNHFFETISLACTHTEEPDYVNAKTMINLLGHCNYIISAKILNFQPCSTIK